MKNIKHIKKSFLSLMKEWNIELQRFFNVQAFFHSLNGKLSKKYLTYNMITFETD